MPLLNAKDILLRNLAFEDDLLCTKLLHEVSST